MPRRSDCQQNWDREQNVAYASSLWRASTGCERRLVHTRGHAETTVDQLARRNGVRYYIFKPVYGSRSAAETAIKTRPELSSRGRSIQIGSQSYASFLALTLTLHSHPFSMVTFIPVSRLSGGLTINSSVAESPLATSTSVPRSRLSVILRISRV